MFPATVMFVYIGTALQSLQQVVSGSFTGSVATQVTFALAPPPPLANACILAAQILFWGGLVATVVVAVLITWLARNAIQQALEEARLQDEQAQRQVAPDVQAEVAPLLPAKSVQVE
jgi:flagellar biosynthesis/type III secretory pathway M-ring protein FliF/YscJ